jgi:hypothetical protein
MNNTESGEGDVLKLFKKPRKVTLYLAQWYTGRNRAEICGD